jgi:hypothetical protein
MRSLTLNERRIVFYLTDDVGSVAVAIVHLNHMTEGPSARTPMLELERTSDGLLGLCSEL